MLLKRGTFFGLLQGIQFGDTVVNWGAFTRYLGVESDSGLKWFKHVSELSKSFTQKLNLLKSFY